MKIVLLLGTKVVIEEKGLPYKEYNFDNEKAAIEFYFLINQ